VLRSTPTAFTGVFHNRIQRAGELSLVDIVLVLADADRLRLDLHQFGKRILQTAGDGNGAAQRDVEVRKFGGRRFPRRNRRRHRLPRR
jgi:hypothetical protein